MSYCRWSTNDFLCDLYCYESDAGFETMVAEKRHVFTEPLPERVALSTETQDAWLARHQKVMAMVHDAELVKIGLVHDGKHFTDDTLEEFLATLLMLKEAGYLFPDYVIEDVKAEIAEAV